MTPLDFIQLLKSALTSVPFVLPVVIALVQWIKSVTGSSDARLLNLCAMLLGVLFGGAFLLAVSMPATYAQWFVVAFFGIVLGLAASGLFKVGAEMAERANPLTNSSASITIGSATVSNGLTPAETAAAKVGVR